jgi:hypothetical protein
LDEFEQMLAGPRSAGRGIFQPHALKKLFAEHRAGTRDNTDRIWRLLNLELWMRIFIDHDPAALGSHEAIGVALRDSAGVTT